MRGEKGGWNGRPQRQPLNHESHFCERALAIPLFTIQLLDYLKKTRPFSNKGARGSFYISCGWRTGSARHPGYSIVIRYTYIVPRNPDLSRAPKPPNHFTIQLPPPLTA
jgi:hypothetical protein